MGNLTAIEIGPRTLAAVTVRENGRGAEIVRSGSAELPAIDAGSVRAALEQCGMAEEVRRQRVVLVLPRGQALLREIELPVGSDEEISSMVRFQAEQKLPLPLDRLHYSWVEIARREGKVVIQVAAVPREILDVARAALEGAGVKISGATVSTFGLLSLVPDGERAVVVEVAAGEAEILVADGGRVELSRTAPLQDGAGAEAIAEELERTLLACTARTPEREIRRVMLAGAGEEASKLAQELGIRLEREVEPAGPGDLETSTGAGVCAGMLRGSAVPDLLKPPVVKRRLRVTKVHRVAALAVAIPLILIVWAQMELSARRDLLEERRQELKDLQPRAEEIARMSAQTALAQKWYRNRYAWLSLLDGIRKSVDRSVLWLESATFEESGSVRIVGKAKEKKHVTTFVTALKETGLFEDIVDQSRTNTGDRSGYRENFTLDASRKGFRKRKR